MEWYKLYGRDFPWRENKIENKPYKILITEFLLQRTKAETIKKIYSDFFSIYPDLKSLTFSKLENLFEFFNKIGLFYRAKRLKEISLEIYKKNNGKIPFELNSLLKLKGIGVYIASATLNFGYDIPTPTVDRNVLRVLNRLNNIRNEIEARDFIMKLYTFGNHKEIAYALIDLGSLLCLNKPLCNNCYLNKICPKHELKKKEWKFLRKIVNKNGEVKLREN